NAADRLPVGRVLIIDACTPTPDQDSGSIDIFNMMRILLELGLRVTFIPESNFLYFGRYTDALQRMGVECLYAPYPTSCSSVLRERCDSFDLVILARRDVAAAHMPDVRRYCPSARVVFNTVDLHFLREERRAALEGRPLSADAARGKRIELDLVARA